MRANWDFSGRMISGNYHGIPYRGIIETTRVCYGTDLVFRVQLMDMIEVFGEWRSVILVQKEKDKENYILDSIEESC
jgi:hypothetical protein